MLLAVLYGCYTVITQVLFIREYFVVAGGNELFIGVFFFTWFLGVVIGAQISSVFSDRVRVPLNSAFILLIAQCLLVPLYLLLIRSLRHLFHIQQGEQIPLVLFWAGTLVTLFPFSCITGVTFPLLCRCLAGENRKDRISIGKIYMADSLGSIAGGLLFTFLFVHLFKPFQTSLIMGTFLIAMILRITRTNPKASPRFKIGITLVLILFALSVITPLGGKMEHASSLVRWRSFAPGFELKGSRETPYQHLSLALREEQYSLLSNGSFVSSFPDPYGTGEEVHLVMTVCPNPKRILILGGGNPQILPVLLEYPVEYIDYVEVDGRLLPFIEPYLGKGTLNALRNPRVRVFHKDGRRFVLEKSRKMAKSKTARYDLVWVDIPEPSTAEANRFYTAEFYGQTLELLNTKGVLVTECSSAVNYFGKSVSEYIQSIYKSLGAVFEEVRATPGTRMYFFASPKKGTITLNPEKLFRRFESRRLESKHFSPYLFSSLLEPFRVDFTEKAIHKGLDRVPLNGDLYPISYLFNLRLWAARTETNMVKWFNLVRSLKTVHVILFLVFLTGIFFLLGFRKKVNAPRKERFTSLFLITTTGICGMAAEVIILYLFQNIYGCMYQKIGLFVAFFMAGLTFGAEGANRYLKNKALDWLSVRKSLIVLESLYWFFFLCMGLVIAFIMPGEIVFYLLVFLAGLLTGAEFPLAGGAYLASGTRLGKAAGKIDMADHAGAAFGALLIGLVLVPAIGIPRTLLILALLKLCSLTLVYFCGKKCLFCLKK